MSAFQKYLNERRGFLIRKATLLTITTPTRWHLQQKRVRKRRANTPHIPGIIIKHIRKCYKKQIKISLKPPCLKVTFEEMNEITKYCVMILEENPLLEMEITTCEE